jgi:hypothetical protein
MIKDQICPTLQALLRSPKHKEMQRLFHRLSQFWDKLSALTTTDICTPDGTVLRTGVMTSFGRLLRNSTWVPVLREECESSKGSVACTQQQECAVGSEVFLNIPAIRDLYAHHVPYLDVYNAAASPFTSFLQIKSSVDAGSLSKSLVAWAARLPSSPGMPTTFVTTLEHMHNVYKFLQGNLIPRDFWDLFDSHPVIFTCKKTDELIQGGFLSKTEVRWADPTHLYSKYRLDVPQTERSHLCRFALCAIYADLKSLFVAINIQPEPSLNDHLALLRHVTHAHRQQDIQADLLSLFGTISSTLSSLPPETRPLPQVKEVLSQHACIPTHGDCFVSLRDQPMIADDRTLQQLFKDSDGLYPPGVHFIETDERATSECLDCPMFPVLFFICRIQSATRKHRGIDAGAGCAIAVTVHPSGNNP